MQLAKMMDFFSVGLLIKTLFTPFRLIDSYSNRGEGLDAKIRAVIDKMIGRLIGAMIRSAVLIFALVVLVLTLALDLIRIALWLLAPSLPIVGLLLVAAGVTL